MKDLDKMITDQYQVVEYEVPEAAVKSALKIIDRYTLHDVPCVLLSPLLILWPQSG